MKTLDICFSPALLNLYDTTGKTVVVTDVLRATSTMVAALANGVEEIVPVSSVLECLGYRERGYVVCAERDGAMMEGFDMGNSPLGMLQMDLKGKKLAITTTNGTEAIVQSAGADTIIAGAFINLSAVVHYLQDVDNDVLIVCAGWKGHINAEDNLFAGAVAELLADSFTYTSDSVLIARALYRQVISDLMGFLTQSSHVNRLKGLGIEEDIKFCLTPDLFDIVPILSNGAMIPLQRRGLEMAV